jgi:hypothetical protein
MQASQPPHMGLTPNPSSISQYCHPASASKKDIKPETASRESDVPKRSSAASSAFSLISLSTQCPSRGETRANFRSAQRPKPIPHLRVQRRDTLKLSIHFVGLPSARTFGVGGLAISAAGWAVKRQQPVVNASTALGQPERRHIPLCRNNPDAHRRASTTDRRMWAI